MMEGEELDLYLTVSTKWCDYNALIINTLKTEDIIFGATRDTPIVPVTVHNQPIKQTSSFKYLGGAHRQYIVLDPPC